MVVQQHGDEQSAREPEQALSGAPGAGAAPATGTTGVPGPEVDRVPKVDPDGGATLLGWLARMRREAPVWHAPDGHAHVFRHEDITKVVTDPATFSNNLMLFGGPRRGGGDANAEQAETAEQATGQAEAAAPETAEATEAPAAEAPAADTDAASADTATDAESAAEDADAAPAQNPAGGQLLMLDPPEHGKLRRIVSRAFTAKMVAELEPRIAEITNELLDTVAGADGFEMNGTLANPLPVSVISMMLGVPVSDRDQFQEWANNLLAVDPEDPESVAGLASTAEALGAYLQGFVTTRRAEPQQDLISQLCSADVGGEQLNDMEVINFSALLLLAGHVTTSVLLGNILLCLDEHPHLYKELREDRDKVPAYIEETLRLRSPFTKIDRVVARDTELNGVRLAKGTYLCLWMLSANRDEDVFDDPDTYLPSRANSRQLAFGHGIHYCIGAPIARLEARIVLNLLLDRYSEIRVDRSERLSFHGSNIFGARSLPLTVSRA